MGSKEEWWKPRLWKKRKYQSLVKTGDVIKGMETQKDKQEREIFQHKRDIWIFPNFFELGYPTDLANKKNYWTK